MSPLEKLGKVQKPPQVYGRCSEGAERSPEGTKKEKSREGEGKGSVIFLMRCHRRLRIRLPIFLIFYDLSSYAPI